MKTYDEYFDEVEKEKVKEAMNIDSTYSTGWLNKWNDEAKEKLVRYAIRQFAHDIFSEAANRQWKDAAAEIMNENEELKGKELIKAIEERVDSYKSVD